MAQMLSAHKLRCTPAMLVQAYESVNVNVQAAEVRAAVERDDNDGSIDVRARRKARQGARHSQPVVGLVPCSTR